MSESVSLAGHLVDLHDREIRAATVHVQDGVIEQIEPTDTVPDRYLLPGFIDAHVHVESSMLPPSEFARAAQVRDKPVDGHAPGVRGDDVQQYAAAGIETDHESFAIEEAREKLAAGMNIAIREGSAARNFDELIPLMDEAPDRLMFCSDDRHPDALGVSFSRDGLRNIRRERRRPIPQLGLTLLGLTLST